MSVILLTVTVLNTQIRFNCLILASKDIYATIDQRIEII